MNVKEKLKWAYGIKTHFIQTIARIFLGFFLLFAGISHLTFAREEFVAQVPEWLPFSDDFVVVSSGFVEIALGLSLIFFSKWKAVVGMVVALFFVLIFPGNVSQYVNEVDAFGLDTDKKRFNRLFFQPVLILWALWSTGALKALKNRNAQ